MSATTRSFAAIALVALLAGCGDDSPQSSADAGDGNAQTPVRSSSSGSAEAAQQDAEPIDVAALEAKGYAIGDIVLGDPNAPVTMIEYASLTCPACKAFHSETLPAIKRDYINTGKLKLVLRELHGHRIGLDASALARCAGPDRFYAFLDVLFSRQNNYRTQDRAENLAELARIGKLGGLSKEKVEACLSDTNYLNKLYQDSVANVEKDQVPATPYLIIQPGPDQETIRGAAPAEQLSAAIDAFLPAE